MLLDADIGDLDVSPSQPLLHEVALEAVEPRLVGIFELDFGLGPQVLKFEMGPVVVVLGKYFGEMRHFES